ncbi:6654_t:CDS:2, partial [Funneliformis mosseae]
MTLPNSTINRKSFRHRKVDNKKPLRIYTPGEINEEDCIPVSRTGIEIETGVEKEEEEEWHLVNALKLRTEYMEKGSTASGKATIPVPTSSRRISYYADAYQTHKWKKPSTYVKFSLPVEECIGCLYCMDEKDDMWLVEHKEKTHSTLTEDQFEEIMQHFENAKKLLPSWLDCEACLPESLQDLKGEAEMIHTYWKTKRKERMSRFRKVGPLMFEIKTQEGKDEEDHPWTCFRRRELKPIRRTRRTETASFDKLRKIRKDIHSGRHIMVNVKIREKTKKQKIELDRKIFEKECTVRELRKKLGIRNETSHEPPKRNRKSSSTMDLMGATKTKSGIKLSKKDDEYPMADITDYPYLIQRKPAAASFFRKFDSLKPTDRTSISCTAFRSRFGRGGRRRRIIDRLDVFSYKRIRETNDRFKYDSDGAEDVFSEDEMNLDDEEDNNKVEDLTEKYSLDALTVNNNSTQSSQQANAESKQILEQRTILDPRYASSISRTADSRVNVNNQDSRQKPDSVNMVQRADSRANINNPSNIDSHYVDPRTFNGVKCNQGVNAESSTSRLNSNPPTPRLSNDPRATRDSRLVNNSIANSRAHNGLIIRPTVATMNHRDNVTPYMRPMPRMISDDSNNTNNVVANNRGLINSSLVKNHATAQLTPVAQINSPASSNNNNINGQGNGDGLRHTSSNQGNVNGTTSMIDPSKGLTTTSGQAIDPSKISMSIDQTKILFNESNQIVNVTTGESAKLVNSVEAQKINNVNLIKPTQRMGIGNGLNGVQQTINTSIHSTSAAAQQFMFTSQDF